MDTDNILAAFCKSPLLPNSGDITCWIRHQLLQSHLKTLYSHPLTQLQIPHTVHDNLNWHGNCTINNHINFMTRLVKLDSPGNVTPGLTCSGSSPNLFSLAIDIIYGCSQWRNTHITHAPELCCFTEVSCLHVASSIPSRTVPAIASILDLTNATHACHCQSQTDQETQIQISG